MSNLPISLETNVKTKLKMIIGELIPEEVLDKIINDTSKEFMYKDLPLLIKEILKEEYIQKIKAELTKEKWQERFGNETGQQFSEAVEKLIQENSGKILSNILGSGFQVMIENLKNNLRTNGLYGY
jgi:hypothetical protein